VSTDEAASASVSAVSTVEAASAVSTVEAASAVSTGEAASAVSTDEAGGAEASASAGSEWVFPHQIGDRVEVHWPAMGQWFVGDITEIDEGAEEFDVHYLDGEDFTHPRDMSVRVHRV